MKASLELVVPLVSSSGRIWHTLAKEAEFEFSREHRRSGVEVEFAVAVETAGQIRACQAFVPVAEAAKLDRYVFDPLELDPTGDPNEPAIRDANGLVDGRGIVEEWVD